MGSEMCIRDSSTTVYDRLEEASATSLPYEVRHNSWWVQEVAGSPASAGPTTFYTLLFIRGPKRVPALTKVVSYFYVRTSVVHFGFG